MILDEALHKLGKSNEDTFVVQIGAMDGVSFDDIVGYFDAYPHWKALYVEPIPYLFERLKSNRPDTNIFENSAIVSEDGPVEMVTIDKDYIENGELHPGFAGMSAVWPPRNGLGTEYDKPVLDKHGQKITVNGITLNTLFNKHGVENFDIFLCDAEGLDCEIFRQLDLNKYSPKIIRLEWMNLKNEEKEEVKQKLEAHGYKYEINGQDIDAVKNSVKNLLLTNRGERPFQPNLGSGLFDLLFENSNPYTIQAVRSKIVDMLTSYEPRINQVRVSIQDLPEDNAIHVKVGFNITSIVDNEEVEFYLERLR